jgi:protoporphyrinogen oxidase
MKKTRVAVLGAGPMGLAVAYQLAIDGHQPVIFEADDRVGGMTACFDFGGQMIERYYHFHCTSDRAFLEVLDELGIGDRMNWVHTKMGYWFLDRLQPWGTPAALIKFKGLDAVSKFRYGLHAFLSTKINNWAPLDPISAEKWIKKWVGNRAYDVLWRNLFQLKFYEYSSLVSAAWIWSRIRRLGRSRSSIFKEKLGYLAGGSQTLLNALSKEILTHGGEIRLSNPVSEVCIEGTVVKGIKVRDQFEAFDKIISTIPLPFIPKIIPNLPKKILDQFLAIKNIAVVCVIVKLKKPITENFWVNTNDPDMDIPGIVEYSNLRPDLGHIVYAPFYMPKHNEKFLDSDEVFIEKVKYFLMKINKNIGNEDFIDAHVSRYAHAQPIGESNLLQKLPPVALPIDGLWVADTSYYYPEDRGISESIDFGRKIARNIF